jgi:hypothetical protein
MGMDQISQVQRKITEIQATVYFMENSESDEAMGKMKELFDTIVSGFDGSPGIQAILLSMALGDIRYIQGKDSIQFVQKWTEWTDSAGLQPRQVPVEQIEQASEIIFGKKDAFVF